MNTLTLRPELTNKLRRRVLLALGTPASAGASNSQLARLLGERRDVIGRHTRALTDAGLVADSGVRGRAGYAWSLTEAGRAQRALLLAQKAGLV